MDRRMSVILWSSKETINSGEIIDISTSKQTNDSLYGSQWHLTQPYLEKEIFIARRKEEISIGFLSHRLSPTQQKWAVIEKEVHVLVHALQKRHYNLVGAEFVIKTDHKLLKYLFETEWKNKAIQMRALQCHNWREEYPLEEYLFGFIVTNSQEVQIYPTPPLGQDMTQGHF